MFLLRGVVFGHEAVQDWEAKLAPVMAAKLRRQRHGEGGARGRHWHADETYLRVRGRWCDFYRASDRDGRLVDAVLSERCNMAAARAFFRSAGAIRGVTPNRVSMSRPSRSRLHRPRRAATALTILVDAQAELVFRLVASALARPLTEFCHEF